MARYQLILAYDGTGFAGFQRQGSRLFAEEGRTVQGVLETALRKLGWQGRSILAAGRTDTGVHALGQVVAFDLDWRHSPESLRAALNAQLPGDVAVKAATLASPAFHPRYDAASRKYHYRVYCQDGRDPLRERFAWRVWPSVDGDRMNLAASLLVGRHDFAAFGTPPRAGGTTVRTVSLAAWRRVTFFPAGVPSEELLSGEWIFEIVADAFLYHMVRRLAHILVAVGQGFLEVSELQKALDAPPRHPLQGLAPSRGLILEEVLYPDLVQARDQIIQKSQETS